MDTITFKLDEFPKEKSNFFSKLFFYWSFDLFKRGLKSNFDVEYLFESPNHMRTSKVGNRLSEIWSNESNRVKHPSLFKVLGIAFWREILFHGTLHLIYEILMRIIHPICLQQILSYFSAESNQSYETGVINAVIFIFVYFFTILACEHFMYATNDLSLLIRSAISSTIYRKTLRLSNSALAENAKGKIINLISNDVVRLNFFLMFVHSLYTSPIITLIIGCLIWNQTGWPGIIGLIIVLIFIAPPQSYLAKLTTIFRFKTSIQTDRRVKFMDEIIMGIQVIKMYAWEAPLSYLLDQARKIELKFVRYNAYCRGVFMTLLLFTTRVSIYGAMVAIVVLQGSDQLTAKNVFVLTAYFTALANTIGRTFTRAITEMAEALVSVKRLQEYLLLDELEDKALYIDPKLSPYSISLNRLTARWPMVTKEVTKSEECVTPRKPNNHIKPLLGKITLNRITVHIQKGSLTAIIGPVGSGKSSLLQAILQQLPTESGTITIGGSISYAAQIPWIFSATVQQNILFGKEMDENRYNEVIRNCDLRYDLKQLQHGDKTLIGEKGINLSGGQKARVNLARAVYSSADIYIFDDPLSAVDTHVGQHLFNRCIGPSSKLAETGATRILVTHQIHFLKDVDWILVMQDGRIDMQGTPDDIANSGIDFAEFLPKVEEVKIEEKSENKRNRSISVVSVTSNRTATDETIDDGVFYGLQLEKSSKGVVASPLRSYILLAKNSLLILWVLFLFILTQFLASAADYGVAFWVSQEEIRYFEATVMDYRNDSYNRTEQMDYFEMEGGSVGLSTQSCMLINGLILVALIVVGMLRTFSFYSMTTRSSQNLHNTMFNGVMSTTMRFFDTNPGGRILNRFSKDIGTIDDRLPKSLLDVTQGLMIILGVVIVTIIMNPWMIIPTIILVFVSYWCRYFYIKVGKNCTRMEAISRSLVLNHLAASVDGIATIRSLKVERILIDQFDRHQDLSNSCAIFDLGLLCGFILSSELSTIGLIIVALTSFLLLGEETRGTDVGLVITQLMALMNWHQWAIYQTTELAKILVGVERTLEYRELPSEIEPIVPKQIPEKWPEYGTIEFRNVIYRYIDKPVLINVNFHIKSNEKIGIVGRTGAGKSSIIGAIFRMAFVEGEVIIDGIDTSTINLKDLRSRISIIPQDPVLFSGTLRRNLDPFERYSDEMMWRIVRKINLIDSTERMGLDMLVSSGGSNFSVGQRQLVCLARAMLKRNKILVLDEATANVDVHTDSLIQRTIRNDFANCTIITIAHRLHTIIDSDRIMVVDQGSIIEFDSPAQLLKNPDGHFTKMVQTLDTDDARLFEEIDKLKV